MKEITLSICMIVRNEEKYIDDCLKSMIPLIENNIAEFVELIHTATPFLRWYFTIRTANLQ